MGCSEILHRIISILLVLVLIPLLLFICLPIYCFRYIIYLTSKIFRPDLTRLLEASSSFFGVYNVFTNNAGPTIITTITVEGSISRKLAIEKFTQVLTIKGDNNKLKYQNLSEYLTKWMGFIFWTQEKDFSIENHIKYANIFVDKDGNMIQKDDSENEEELSEQSQLPWSNVKLIEKQLLRTGYNLNRSPWEFNIVKNVRPKFAKEGVLYDACIFKVHHSMGDGYGFIKMMIFDLCAQDKNTFVLPELPKRNLIVEFMLNLLAWFRAPFDIVFQMTSKPDENVWHLPVEQLSGNSKAHLAESNLIPVEYLKRVKNKYGVEFKTVLFEAVTAAVRTTMLKRGDEIPESITCMIPFPFPGHPDKLGNYWSVQAIRFPVGELNCQRRIQNIETQLKNVKNSTGAISVFKVQPIIGSLFYWMVKPLAHFIHPTGIISDVPGPSVSIPAFGCPNTPIVDFSYLAGLPYGNVGIMMLSMSYNGNWKCNVLVDNGLMSSDAEVQNLVDNIENELKKLYMEVQI